MRLDVIVVGAGPSGSTAARLLARDHEVAIMEEHRNPGEPVQCAGLVSHRGIPDFARESVLSEVRGARIHSPMGFTLTLEARRTRACVIDRTLFDRLLFEKAVDQGAKPITGASVRDLRDGGDTVSLQARIDGTKTVFSAGAVVGADGFRSVCRRKAKFRPPRHTLKGIQADIKGIKLDSDFVDVYMGRDVAPGFFAWVIPAGDITRVGVCTWHSEDLPAVYLRKLLSRSEFAGGKRVSMSAGKIPIGAGKTATRGRVLLVGDAACHAKPLSGGGVFTGTKGAELCSKSVSKYLSSGDPLDLVEYDVLWKEAFGRELARAFRIRRIFIGLSDKKMDKALKIVAEPAVVRLLQNKGDIDYPASLTKTVLKLAPKLAQFSPEIIESFL